MKRSIIAVVVCAILIHAAVESPGDVIVTKDGRVLEGKIISKTDKEVILQVTKYGGRMSVKIPIDQIVSITEGEIEKPTTSKPAKPKKLGLGDVPEAPAAPEIVKYDGPTYYIIPFKGTVGKEVLASLIDKSIEDALKRKPTVIVLEIESPGGLLAEVDKIIKVIRKHNEDVRIVSFIKRGLSAAAISAMSTKEIYMQPEALIGAATSYFVGGVKPPKEVVSKVKSVWEATARSCAETGGHSPLLAVAMIDPNLEIHLAVENGKKVVKEGKGPKSISKRGKLLTLTGMEAVNVGLAAATTKDYEQLGKRLGLGGWVECKGHGVLLADHWTKAITKVQADSKKLMEQYEDNMRQARENAPNRYQYTIWQHNGQFTPQSKKLWRTRSGTCSRFLRRAEKDLEKATKVAEDYPQLLMSADRFTKLRKEIASIRRIIAKGIHNKSPNG